MNAHDVKSCAYFAQSDQVANASAPISGIRSRLPKTKFNPVMPRMMNDAAVTQCVRRSRVLNRRILMPDSGARVPYVVAMVDLAEGPRLMTELVDCPAENLCAGMQLAIDFRTEDDGFVVPVFRPAPDST